MLLRGAGTARGDGHWAVRVETIKPRIPLNLIRRAILEPYRGKCPLSVARDYGHHPGTPDTAVANNANAGVRYRNTDRSLVYTRISKNVGAFGDCCRKRWPSAKYSFPFGEARAAADLVDDRASSVALRIKNAEGSAEIPQRPSAAQITNHLEVLRLGSIMGAGSNLPIHPSRALWNCFRWVTR